MEREKVGVVDLAAVPEANTFKLLKTDTWATVLERIVALTRIAPEQQVFWPLCRIGGGRTGPSQPGWGYWMPHHVRPATCWLRSPRFVHAGARTPLSPLLPSPGALGVAKVLA